MTTSPTERIAAGYAASPDPKHDRRRASIARAFKPEPRMEAILALPEAKREAMLGRNPKQRMAFGSYVQSKKVYEEMNER